MDVNRVYVFLIPILLVIGLGNCGVLGGDEKDDRIIWEDENIDDFVIYAHSYVSDYLYIIDPSNGDYEINDSFQTIHSIITNVDGSILYVSTGDENSRNENGNIYEVDTKTWESVDIYNKPVEFIQIYQLHT
jgi:hypothetical protein